MCSSSQLAAIKMYLAQKDYYVILAFLERKLKLRLVPKNPDEMPVPSVWNC